jgi:hypothetical protein
MAAVAAAALGASERLSAATRPTAMAETDPAQARGENETLVFLTGWVAFDGADVCFIVPLNRDGIKRGVRADVRLLQARAGELAGKTRPVRLAVPRSRSSLAATVHLALISKRCPRCLWASLMTWRKGSIDATEDELLSRRERRG